MAGVTPVCNFGWRAPPFDLPGTDGERHNLLQLAGPNGLLVMFICNHCPYVIALHDKISRDARDLQAIGIGVVAINANDAADYPADSFENMVRLAQQLELPFPYLHDEDQSVAKAYGAVCTPDFFGFNAGLGLQYRGQLDASRGSRTQPGLRRDLFEAMKGVAETGRGPADQSPSVGCSIKWKSGW